jgi:hypothetical protein
MADCPEILLQDETLPMKQPANMIETIMRKPCACPIITRKISKAAGLLMFVRLPAIHYYTSKYQ